MLRQKAECFFWYRPTRVVPEQRPLNGCCCVVVMVVQSALSGPSQIIIISLRKGYKMQTVAIDAPCVCQSVCHGVLSHRCKPPWKCSPATVQLPAIASCRLYGRCGNLLSFARYLLFGNRLNDLLRLEMKRLDHKSAQNSVQPESINFSKSKLIQLIIFICWITQYLPSRTVYII